MNIVFFRLHRGMTKKEKISDQGLFSYLDKKTKKKSSSLNETDDNGQSQTSNSDEFKQN